MNLEKTKKLLHKYKGKQETYTEIINNSKEQIKYWEDRLASIEEARGVIQLAAQQTQNMLKEGIEKIVTSALQIIPFQEDYEFSIEFVTRRNTTECDLFFKRGENKIKPLDSCGYGAADIASFALRVAYWKIHGELRNVLIYDEPFSNLDKSKHEFAAEIIKELSDKLGIQFIISSHEPTIIKNADKIFNVKIVNGKSKTKEEIKW